MNTTSIISRADDVLGPCLTPQDPILIRPKPLKIHCRWNALVLLASACEPSQSKCKWRRRWKTHCTCSCTSSPPQRKRHLTSCSPLYGKPGKPASTLPTKNPTSNLSSISLLSPNSTPFVSLSKFLQPKLSNFHTNLLFLVIN